MNPIQYMMQALARLKVCRSCGKRISADNPARKTYAPTSKEAQRCDACNQAAREKCDGPGRDPDCDDPPSRPY